MAVNQGDATPDNPLILVELAVTEIATGTLRTLRYCDRREYGYVDGGANQLPYVGRIQNPGTLVIDLISAWTKGLAAYGIGSLVLVNSDGALDDLARLYVFDGGAITYYFGTIDASGTLTRQRFFSGIMEQPDVGRSVTIPVRTAMYSMDQPMLTKTFLGTGGLEGDATILGRIKPRVVGIAQEIPMIPVDSSNQVYFLSDTFLNPSNLTFDGVQGVGYVEDSGLPYVFDPKPGWSPFVSGSAYYTTYAALLAVTIAVGHYAMLFVNTGGNADGTYVRLGGLPGGVVTAKGHNQQALNQVISDVLASNVTLPSGVVGLDVYYPLTGGNVYPTPTAFGLSFGRYVDDNTTTYADVFAGLAAAYGGWVFRATGLTNTGLSDGWLFGQFPNDDTIGSVKAVVAENDVLDIRKIGNPKTPGEGVPPFKITVECWRNEVVQSSGLAATVTATRRALLGAQYSTRVKTNLAVLTKWPLAQALVITGRGLADYTPVATDNTQALTDALFTALNLGADFYSIRVKLSASLTTAALVLGGFYWLPCVSPAYGAAFLGIKSTRFGFTTAGNGTKFQPMAVSLDLLNKEVTYVGWTTYRAG